jgi:hypothetical protein
MNQIERYGLWTVLRQFMPKSAYEARDDTLTYTKDLVDRRMRRGFQEGRTDVFNYLLNDKGDQEMTKGELYNNAQTLVIAGSETTATLLSGLTWYLLRNPGKLAKVRHEVRSTFNDDSEIDSQTILQLPYMIAVVQEGLRIFPPSPFGFPRRIKSKDGQFVAGHWVPRNVSNETSELVMCALLINANRVCVRSTFLQLPIQRKIGRDQKSLYLNDGCRMPATSSQMTNVSQASLLVLGREAVLGRSKSEPALPLLSSADHRLHVTDDSYSLAYAEMRLILAKMLWNFDFELADPTDDWMSRNLGYSLWYKGPLMVKLTQSTSSALR